MKKLLLSCALLPALLLLPSCREKEAFDEGGGDRLQLRIESVLPEPRVGLNAARTAYVWQTGDVLAVFNNLDDSCEPLDFGEGSGSVSVPGGTSTIYALSPWTSAQVNGPDRAVVEIPASQTQAAAGAIDRGRYPMAASGSVSEGSVSLTFEPLCSALALNLYKSSDWRDSEYLQSVTVEPLHNSTFCGRAELDLTAGSIPAFTAGDSDSDRLTLTLDEPVLLGNGAPAVPLTFANQLYLLLARQQYRELRFSIRTNRAIYTLTSSSSFVFDATAYDFLLTGIDLSKGTITLTLSGENDPMTEKVVVYEQEGDFTALDPIVLPDTLSLDIVPDFSRVGYHYGDRAVPERAVTRTIRVSDITDAIAAGTVADTTAYLQNAIDELGAAGGGVILLKDGTYNTSRILFIDYDNVVLRGESEAGTVIKAIDTRPRTVVALGKSLPSAGATLSATRIDESGRVATVSNTKLGSVGDRTVGSFILHQVRPAAVSRSISTLYSSSITEDAPCGRLYVTVQDGSLFAPGDRVVVYRPATLDWIHDIWMDRIAWNGRDETNGGGTIQWSENLSNYNRYWERRVVGVSGNRIYLDAPLVMSLQGVYGGGFLQKVSWSRVYESGVENLTIDCNYDPSLTYDSTLTSNSSLWGQPYDEAHAWIAVNVSSAEHCWVRSVTSRHMGFSCVYLGSGARCVSVLDCSSLDPVSVILGSRRYAFELGGAELCLVRNCYTNYDRHSFVSGGVCGPNVFSLCRAEHPFSTIGPHNYWATGTLYDRVSSSGAMEAQDAGNGGTGHGWRGANIVYWNCEPGSLSINSPQVSAYNYAVGTVGQKVLNIVYTNTYWSGVTTNDPYQDYMEELLGTLPTWNGRKISRPEGRWYPQLEFGESGTEHVSLPFNPGLDWWPRLSGTSFSDPLSLYQCQLEDRHARGINLNSL
ncbi:MAG: hypothetical protein IJV01_04465 [Bacteroidales bacterium]|nr:hypothetical protein [Bacteroidales bacterium]